MNNNTFVLFMDATNSNINAGDDNFQRINGNNYAIATDVSLKRRIRDYWDANNQRILNKTHVAANGDVFTLGQVLNKAKEEIGEEISKNLLLKFVDNRAFGIVAAIADPNKKKDKKNNKKKSNDDEEVTIEETVMESKEKTSNEKSISIKVQGAVQIEYGISINKINNVTDNIGAHVASAEGMKSPTRGTKNRAEYIFMKQAGRVNSRIAEENQMTQEDRNNLLKALWEGNGIDTSSRKIKTRMLINVEFKEGVNCNFDIMPLIKATWLNGYDEETVDSIENVAFNFDLFFKAIKFLGKKIKAIEYAAEFNVKVDYENEIHDFGFFYDKFESIIKGINSEIQVKNID